MVQENASAKKMSITGDWIIGDIMSEYPEKAEEISEALADFGIHCAGCVASSFETLEDGVLGHGFSDEELVSLVEDLNEIVGSPLASEATSKDFSITSQAKEMLTTTLKTQKSQDSFLRLFAEIEEETGVIREMEFVTKSLPNDAVIFLGEIKIAIDKASSAAFKEVTLDYDKDQKGFVFLEKNSPNQSCSN